MESRETLYEVLQLSPRASNEVIRAAYRCLAQYHHPDKNAGAEVANERLAQINLAYAILSDAVQRLRYDRSLGLHDDFVERRGVQAPSRGRRDGATAGHPVARPFSFRPL